ncbi:hypothetical protein F3Y22_tig00111565pilonHSYRG00006 [Hibiscus syriacus]|uniref:RNase H type-1 domain-containing protein n=1 Tax=Hibiscus syriacus TaxID=106335 RepID=A0A6A2XN85_HIBSY|nr:hypothetical protein F3Y22_tig00111565pilonHSYRG00006 [Hibiscus syriacus]
MVSWVAQGIWQQQQQEFCVTNGAWLFGFSRSLGVCSVLNAELWEIHTVLAHAWEFGTRQIIMESDSANCAMTVQLINQTTKGDAGNTIVVLIRELLNRSWVSKVNHISREMNRVADRLASMTRGQPIGVQLHHDVPLEIAALVAEEKNPSN